MKVLIRDQDLRKQHYQVLYEKEKREREKIQKTLHSILIKLQLKGIKVHSSNSKSRSRQQVLIGENSSSPSQFLAFTSENQSSTHNNNQQRLQNILQQPHKSHQTIQQAHLNKNTNVVNYVNNISGLSSHMKTSSGIDTLQDQPNNHILYQGTVEHPNETETAVVDTDVISLSGGPSFTYAQ